MGEWSRRSCTNTHSRLHTDAHTDTDGHRWFLGVCLPARCLTPCALRYIHNRLLAGAGRRVIKEGSKLTSARVCYIYIYLSLINLPQDLAYAATTRVHDRRILGRRNRVSVRIMTGDQLTFARANQSENGVKERARMDRG